MRRVSRRGALRALGGGAALAGTAAFLSACGESSSEAAPKVVTVEKIVTVEAPAGPMQGTILVDGSSTVGPITQAVAEEFRSQFPQVRVPVGISGTGGGFKKFCKEETDVSDASRFIRSSEQELCGEAGIEYIELPVAIDGIAVVVNPKNTAIGDSITVEELNKMWAPESEDNITSWAQIRDGLPDQRLILYGPGTDSGTYDYFTKVINGAEGASRGDFTPSEDDNVLVQGIAGDTNAAGFFGLAYYEQNTDVIKALKVDGGDGPVFPTTDNVLSGKYAPLSRVIFIYVSTQAAERPEVQTFIDFYMKNASGLAGSVGYVSLPAEMYEMGLERFNSRKVGSVRDTDPEVGESPSSVLEAWKAGA